LRATTQASATVAEALLERLTPARCGHYRHPRNRSDRAIHQTLAWCRSSVDADGTSPSAVEESTTHAGRAAQGE